MADIYLTKEQWNRLPYKSTTIKKGKTHGDIIGLLETHNIKNYQLTSYQGSDQLAFPLTIKREDVEREFSIKLMIPKLYYLKPTHRGRNSPKTMTYLENTSWRMFWWYLKSKLEAIEFGISDEVREFMYNINYALPNGREVSLGQAIMNNIDQVGQLAALEERKVVNVDYVEVEKK